MSIQNKPILLIFLILFANAFSVSAFDVEVDGIYYELNGDIATVTFKDTQYNSYSGSVRIPESINYENEHYKVMSIGKMAFCDCIGLVAVDLPSTIRSIGTDAFYGCTSIKTIAIPEGVTVVESSSFQNCASLASVYLPSTIENIRGAAFRNCGSIKDIYCPSANPPLLASNSFSTSQAKIHVYPENVEKFKSASYWKSFDIVGDLQEMSQCAPPVIQMEGGKIKFTCATDGSECHYIYNVSANGSGSGDVALNVVLKVTAYATAPGFKDSQYVTKSFELENASGVRGDVNKDGVISIADANEIVNMFLGK